MNNLDRCFGDARAVGRFPRPRVDNPDSVKWNGVSLDRILELVPLLLVDALFGDDLALDLLEFLLALADPILELLLVGLDMVSLQVELLGPLLLQVRLLPTLDWIYLLVVEQAAGRVGMVELLLELVEGHFVPGFVLDRHFVVLWAQGLLLELQGRLHSCRAVLDRWLHAFLHHLCADLDLFVLLRDHA